MLLWRFVAIQMLEHCTSESALRNYRMYTELSASPWIQKAAILECFSQTPKQGKRCPLKHRQRSSQSRVLLFMSLEKIDLKSKRTLWDQL